MDNKTISETVNTDINKTNMMSEPRKVAANNIVTNHIIASITPGLIPIPLLGLSALTANQMNIPGSLSEHYEVPFNDMDSKSLIIFLVAGSFPVISVLGLSSFAKLIASVGSLVDSTSLSAMADSVTYPVSQVFIMHLEGSGTLEDFDARQSFVRDIRDEVKTAKTVKPENE